MVFAFTFVISTPHGEGIGNGWCTRLRDRRVPKKETLRRFRFRHGPGPFLCTAMDRTTFLRSLLGSTALLTVPSLNACCGTCAPFGPGDRVTARACEHGWRFCMNQFIALGPVRSAFILACGNCRADRTISLLGGTHGEAKRIGALVPVRTTLPCPWPTPSMLGAARGAIGRLRKAADRP